MSKCRDVPSEAGYFSRPKDQHLFRSLHWTREIKNQLPEAQLKASLIKKSNLKIFTQITPGEKKMTIGNYFISSASEVDNIVLAERKIELADRILDKKMVNFTVSPSILIH